MIVVKPTLPKPYWGGGGPKAGKGGRLVHEDGGTYFVTEDERVPVQLRSVFLSPERDYKPHIDYDFASINDVTLFCERELMQGRHPNTGQPVHADSVDAQFIDRCVAERMTPHGRNPNHDSAAYYSNADPHSYGYLVFWNIAS